MPHYRPSTHPHRSIHDRSAQFAPFAALTGHKEAIKETARITGTYIELDENEKDIMDEHLRDVQALLEEATRTKGELPLVHIEYFAKDTRKEGGRYISYCGRLKKILSYEKELIFVEGFRIPISTIVDVRLEM